LYKKTIYKFLLKQFYFRTNKTKNWKKQILIYNIRYYNLIAIKDFIIYLKIKTTIVAKQKSKKEITLSSRNLIIILIVFNLNNNILLFDFDKNNYYWQKVESIAINN